jgi:hypothetical protein
MAVRGGYRKAAAASPLSSESRAVAKLIIEFAKAGHRDPERLWALALQGYQSKPRGNFLAQRCVAEAEPPSRTSLPKGGIPEAPPSSTPGGGFWCRCGP